MNFETFIREIHKSDWMIVAMKEYSMDGVKHLYVVVKKKGDNRCIKAEGSIFDSPINEHYGNVFKKILEKIKEVESYETFDGD